MSVDPSDIAIIDAAERMLDELHATTPTMTISDGGHAVATALAMFAVEHASDLDAAIDELAGYAKGYAVRLRHMYERAEAMQKAAKGHANVVPLIGRGEA